MITQWTISGFKSATNETRIDLAPLTILAGANSSGKSTLIQSILTICQSLSGKIGQYPVILNGPLVKLGQFDDVKSCNTSEPVIRIEWTFESLKYRESLKRTDRRYIRPYLFNPGEEVADTSRIECSIAFDAGGSKKSMEWFQLRPRLTSLHIRLKHPSFTMPEHFLRVTINKSARMKNPQDLKFLHSQQKYLFEMDERSEVMIKRGYSSAEPEDCIFRHFFPEALSLRVLSRELRSNQIISFFSRPSWIYRDYEGNENLKIPTKFAKSILERIGVNYPDSFLPEKEPEITIRHLLSIPRQLTREQLHALSASSSYYRQDLEDMLSGFIAELNVEEDVSEENMIAGIPARISSAICFMERYFTQSVKYLGPLRDEPKPVYPLTAQTEPTDMGLKGEATAAVLNIYYNQKVSYIPSNCFVNGLHDPRSEKRTLEEAVNDWLKYLDVAEKVTGIDKGKHGHEMRVRLPDVSQERDLTHVGVGVSQVLPILVQSLLAEQDAFLIFEQPELHLHPKVQTRLADFFLSLTYLKKQCLIETHSEYLINRLRFRAAESKDDDIVKEILKLYFVSKEQGSSVFREVKVNSYGAILEWPEGFFDQGPAESEAILRAAMLKRSIHKGQQT